METIPLRIYVDRNRVATWAYIPLLYPFWGLQTKDTLPYLKAAFTKHGWDSQYFTVVETPEHAECIVFPHDYWWAKKNQPALLNEYIALSKKYAVPLLFDGLGDTDGVIDIPNTVILRNNQYRFELPKNEVTTPYAVEDLLESYCGGNVTPRAKSDVPSVGFIGFTGFTFLERVRMWGKELPIILKMLTDGRYVTHRNGRVWREWAMDAFSFSPRVSTHFMKRPSYSGHVKTVVGDMQKNRAEFVANLLDSDYALVVRGIPNASQRFYEVLAVGRIPVLVDTECVLPLHDYINYKDCCVLIDYKSLPHAADILADFHAALSPEKYREMQYKAREVYEKYLRIDSFSKYLPELIRSTLI